MTIDTCLPAGNALFDAVTHAPESIEVVLRPDLRDTVEPWFWWAFRLQAPTGTRLSVRLSRPHCLTARGPVYSSDRGARWQYLPRHTGAESFDLTLPEAPEHWFAMAVPYTEPDWQACVAGLSPHPAVALDTLCQSRGGRAVECAQIRNPAARHCVSITCRHHACESIASFALEGLLTAWLTEPACGWLREHAALFAVPFVDKDGVERGDQGKSRQGHDHNRDYVERRYPEIAALTTRLPAWAGDRWRLALDLHCPWIHGPWNEHVYLVNAPHPALAARNRAFAALVERQDRSGLAFRAEGGVLENGVAWNRRQAGDPPTSHCAWAATHPSIRVTGTFEIPYAVTPGGEVTPPRARAFGAALARAIADALREGL